MDVLIIILALGLLMFLAFRGFSVILFAPLCALFAVFLTDPTHVLPYFSNIYMVKLVDFVRLYFPVFILGALFGKLVEISGVAKSIAKIIVQFIGPKQAILAIVLMGAILTYSGVSLFVAVFAIYPFANQLFREANIPKRLIPATIAVSAFTFSMDALPGSPQIQNVIPTTFFNTNIYAAPLLGSIGAIFIATFSLLYLNHCRKKAAKIGEGYFGIGDKAINKEAEAELAATSIAAMESTMPSESIAGNKITRRDWLAFIPLLIVGVMNKFFTEYIPVWYANGFDFAAIGLETYGSVNMSQVIGIWSVELALIMGILATILVNVQAAKLNFKSCMQVGISGSLLATMNTASEYGFGGIIAALPGFSAIQDFLTGFFSNPLLNGAIMTNVLCGITGSGSGGLSISLGLMADTYIQAAQEYGIPLEVLHRVLAMSAGGFDTLPHNGAVITLLLVCGLTHRQAYKDIFAITVIKTLAVFFIIGVFSLFAIV
ncbi:GntP family permease [Calidifontibacillus erzurumensis]|uniref:GntP family permease n=1 Tax=Calidifontibacillus erzurumensis TaxID=2741433 RepID=A0A8J8KBU6_9BACI|nr:GntP family permease [Calidifontibacillus erzurumensis]NSL51398.1 GntP family permease [Calidifontibacillus erzurumensis]